MSQRHALSWLNHGHRPLLQLISTSTQSLQYTYTRNRRHFGFSRAKNYLLHRNLSRRISYWLLVSVFQSRDWAGESSICGMISQNNNRFSITVSIAVPAKVAASIKTGTLLALWVFISQTDVEEIVVSESFSIALPVFN